MSKKMKLNLKDINVQSFVTSLEENSAKTVKGGETENPCNTRLTCNFKCGETEWWDCGNTDFCSVGPCPPFSDNAPSHCANC